MFTSGWLQMRFLYVFLFLVLSGSALLAQTADTSNKDKVVIENTSTFISIQTDSGIVQKFLLNVRIKHGDSYMYCDSAYLYSKTNNLEAFSNVRIDQPGGTEAKSDYMRYTSKTKVAYMKGNVSLTDGKGKLNCEELTYSLSDKNGTYTQGGTLQNDATTVSSNTGFYNVRSKDSRFVGDVIVSDPQFNIRSQDLTYNTETKIIEFFAPSVITDTDKSVLRTSRGTYDSKNKIAHTVGRSSVLHGSEYIEADTLRYNKLSGYNYAAGQVVAIDTAHHSTLYCGLAEYYQKSGKLWATIKPVLKQMNNKDSLFIRADTFYSAPIFKRDTLKKAKAPVVAKKKDSKEKQKKSPQPAILPEVIEDTTAAFDTSAPRFYIGYHHVLIFSDSMQGRCDSISYMQTDSTIRMMYSPVIWSHKSQITGDTIIMRLDSSRLKRLFVPNNAFVVSQSGPAKAKMFDQIQGKTLVANFVNNAITDITVWPNAESIYFSKDDKNYYLGVNQAQGEKVKLFFKDQKLQRILYIQEAKQTMTPLTKINISTTRLSRFQWLEDKRPKSREELFE